jgi:hypothetical protein
MNAPDSTPAVSTTQVYVYESPDRGDTVYRRRAGTNQRELIQEGPLRQKMLRSQLWRDIFQAAESDPALQEMIEKIEVYHTLKNTAQGSLPVR